MLWRMDVLRLLIRNRNIAIVSPIYLPSPLQHLLHVTKYATLDELHDNDPGIAINVAPGSEKEGLVSIKLHIYIFLYHIYNFIVMLWWHC